MPQRGTLSVTLRLSERGECNLGINRLQGAALVAVRYKFIMSLFADGHKGRTLQSSV